MNNEKHRAVFPSAKVLLTELPDGTGVLLHLDTKFYYALNRTAVAMWRAIVSTPGVSVDGLAAALATHFHVDRETALADIEDMLRELREQQIVLDE